MPVIDHDIHKRTRQAKGFRYPCHNKPRPQAGSGYWAPDREYQPDGSFIVGQKFVSFDWASKECRNDMGRRDKGCKGCCHRWSGEAYSKTMIEKAREQCNGEKR